MAFTITLDISNIADDVDRRTSLIMARTKTEGGEVVDEIRAASIDSTTIDMVEIEVQNFATMFNRYISNQSRLAGSDEITFSIEAPLDTTATPEQFAPVAQALIVAKVVYEWMVLNRIGDQAQHMAEEYKTQRSRAFHILSMRKRKAAGSGGTGGPS